MTKDEEQFFFIGEVLALDLVNTEAIIRGKWSDLLGTIQDVKDWWNQVGRRYPEVSEVRGAQIFYDAALMDAIKTLRTALRHLFGALVEGSGPMDADVQILNEALRTGYHELELKEGDILGVYHTYGWSKGAIEFPIALSALKLIQGSERERLHKCENERCNLYFYDTTRSATRRWCSLGCMDRARSALRYRQRKEKASLPDHAEGSD